MHVWKCFACHIGLVKRECHETAEICRFPQIHHQEQLLVSKKTGDAVLIKRKGLYQSDCSPRLQRGGLAMSWQELM